MVGLQLYTVRKLMRDAAGCAATLREITKIGYEAVQLYGNIERLEQFAEACLAESVSVLGVLTDLDVCEEHGERIFDLCERLGARDIGISGHVESAMEARDFVRRTNAFAKLARERGFTFSYHNHSTEFIRTEEGKTVMDIFLEELSCDVYFMPDTFWLQHGGIDVRDFIERVAKRCEILHLKDMCRVKGGQDFAALGAGNLNMRGIVKTALGLGINTLVVEQDESIDPIAAVRASYNFLKSEGVI